MAMTGHKTTQMVRRYIKEANLLNNALNKLNYRPRPGQKSLLFEGFKLSEGLTHILLDFGSTTHPTNEMMKGLQ